MSDDQDNFETLLVKLSRDRPDLEEVWKRFPLFHPSCRYVKSKEVKKTLEEDRDFILKRVQRTSFPHLSLEGAEHEFGQAVDRGIVAVNKLCTAYLGENANFFYMLNRSYGFHIDKELRKAKEKFEELNRKHGDARNKRFDLYDLLKGIGLGHLVLMIDQDVSVLTALRSYGGALRWFDSCFTPVKTDQTQNEFYCWNTSIGVTLYGTEKNAIRSRLKFMEDGKMKYRSVLMKMLNSKKYPDDLTDYIGVEFVVADEEQRSKLKSFFAYNVGFTSAIEQLDDRTRKKTTNEHSATDLTFLKFITRAPVLNETPVIHPIFGQKYCERVPVEVQVYTLDEHYRRQQGDAAHEAYKKKQFDSIFPILFPRIIYEPILNHKTGRFRLENLGVPLG